VVIRLDGALLKRFTVGGEAKGRTMPESYAGNTQGDPEFEIYMHTADAGLEVRVPVKAGEHQVGISFVRRLWEPEGVRQPPQTGFGRTTNEYYHGNPAVETVSIGGPYHAAATVESPSRRKLFICTPTDSTGEETCAKRILSTLATRAYRRPLTEDDRETLLSFYKAGRAGQNFDAGIQQGVERILAATEFFVPHRTRAFQQGAGLRLPSQRSRSGVPIIVFSVEQRSRRRTFAGGDSREAQGSGAIGTTGPTHAPRSAFECAGGYFANRWLELNKLPGIVPDTKLFQEFDAETPGIRLPRRHG
jgi:Protein of unknown function (DUF1595)